MNKTIIAAAVGTVLGSSGLSAQAVLTNSAVLAFTAGNFGTFVNDVGAAGPSYFSMAVDTFGNIIYTGMQPGTDGGIHIGTAQPLPAGVFSHGGLPYDITYPTAGYTSDYGPIDLGWGFFNNTGLHFTDAPVTVVENAVGGDPNVKTLDFSGWNVSWNSIPAIYLGGDTKPVKTYSNGTGLATIACSTASCSNSSSFTLDYAAVIYQGDPSNFGGTPYALHLEGYVTAVPVPAAAWLLVSGLAGLLGAARRGRSLRSTQGAVLCPQ